jgi:transposase
MQHAERLTLAEMREFLSASNNLSFAGTGRQQIYGLVEGVLRTQKHLVLGKKDKGIVRRYLVKISGLSVAQITRLIARWRERGLIEPRTSRRYRFPRRYTNDDILLLAKTAGAHEGLSAPAMRRIHEREFKVHRQAKYERLASISASHIYNLRRTRAYREQRVHHTKTRASAVSIGERRKPEPRGRPGFLRVDTVHQGDTGSRKGIYHINAVDTVTQRQIVGCCETISEAHLMPVLEAILHQFPFRIRGFHSDNGSEFLNHRVEKLLNKLLVSEFTKSRANRTTDNALVEGKNGAVVRKHIGHDPIGARHAGQAQRFYTADFNPYLNYHRPCGFAAVELSDNGKRRRCYRHEDYRTPYEKLLSLNDWESGLKEGISAARLEQQALRMSDTECALRMQQRKRKLLDACRSRRSN